MFSARRAAKATATGSLLARRGSVTTMTRLAPSFFMSKPTSRVTPGPYLMLEVSIVNALSLTAAVLSAEPIDLD